MSPKVSRPARCALPLVFAVFATTAALGDLPAESESLYARLGGLEKVTVIVGETIDHSVATPELKRSFENVDVERVKRLIVEQICELAGGGCHYSGETMRDVHAGLALTETEMNGLVEALRDSMRQHGIGLRERNELLALLAPMKRDIVEQ
jgi:hemoglobin